MSNNFSGKEHVTFIGVVEDRQDPMEINRVRVRMYALDTDDKSKTPTNMLVWAMVKLPTTTNNNSPTHLPEGCTVTGYFLDGRDMQQPIVDGILTGMAREGLDKRSEGFTDPRASLEGFPQNPEKTRVKAGDNLVSGLWRGVGSFINGIKNTLRKVGSTGAGGAMVQEPPQSYATKYPYNHGYESESGSGYEIDDTPASERVHIFHRTGSYIEIHPDGTVVKKSTANDYLVVLGTQNTIIAGDEIIVVEGSSRVRINNDAVMEVTAGSWNIDIQNGNVNMKVNGNVVQDVTGNVDYNIQGNLKWNVSGNWNAVAAKYTWS